METTPHAILETTAEEHSSFRWILWRIVNHILGSSVRPVYVVFWSSLMSVGDEFRADVRISPCPRGTNQPYLIQGGRMPTLGLAIQVAAWECLVRLRSSEPLLAETREFYYLPARPQPREEMAQADVSKEPDPALINQVAL